MALIVHKYGGTSMGSTERIRNVAKRVAKWVRAGHQLVVVPSAMSGETNRILGLAKELFPGTPTSASMRELDMIASTGEQVSVGLLALALQAEGLESVSYTGWQVPVKTDSSYTKARIESIDDTRVRADLAAGKVVVITGFQGIDGDGHITTLCPRRAACRPSRSRRCSRWPAWAPRCCRSARWNSPASTGCRCACCPASRTGTSTSMRKPARAR
jgi:aspartate kinase